MIDIFSFNKSLKATWIKKYLDVNNKGSWKTFFDLEFRQFGGDYANLHKREILCMSSYMSCPFVKEILEIWSDLFFCFFQSYLYGIILRYVLEINLFSIKNGT